MPTIRRAVAAATAAVAASRKPRVTVKKMQKTKTRTASKTVQRKPKSQTEIVSTQFSRSTYAKGRVPPQDLRSAWKLLKQNVSSSIYAMRQYSQFGGTNGVQFLSNKSPTTTTGPFFVPCHIYELNACPNIVNNTVTNPTIAWYPTFSDPTATATLSWTRAFQYTPENIDFNSAITDNYPGANDTLDWVSARMLFYAPTTRASRIQVDVVQIKDTRLVPDDTTGVSTFAAAFWQSMSKKFAYSPLEQGDTQFNKYLKVLDSKTFIMESKESTESVNTNMKELNLFYRFNRKCTYNWEDQDRMGMLVANDGQLNTDVNVKTQVHPRSRIFLIIRGQATNTTADSTTLHPSYDIVLRAKHSQLAS